MLYDALTVLLMVSQPTLDGHLNNRGRRQIQSDIPKGLFASCVVSVTFRFGTIFPFSGSLPMVLFAFLHPHQHPLGFIVNASAEQGLNRQMRHPSREFNSDNFI
jgi:hypothetical protein